MDVYGNTLAAWAQLGTSPKQRTYPWECSVTFMGYVRCLGLVLCCHNVAVNMILFSIRHFAGNLAAINISNEIRKEDYVNIVLISHQ